MIKSILKLQPESTVALTPSIATARSLRLTVRTTNKANNMRLAT
ncbi:TPA: hypothetical protein ACTUT5_001292 [Legionella anisa]|nr:hypothetical protein [Legionella anisa]